VAADASFDVVSKLDLQEVRNAVEQATKEIGQRFDFKPGETIHTENSYKYTVPDFQALARRSRFEPQQVWTDDRNMFSVHLMIAV